MTSHSGGKMEKVGASERTLYIGNLDPRVTEYAIIKLCKKYGKIVREQYLWHTAGPKRGLPRGYCFVEFATREEANKAKLSLNGKTLAGRRIVVRFSGEKVAGESSASTGSSIGPYRSTEGPSHSAEAVPRESERAIELKVNALKAKLEQMEKDKTREEERKKRPPQ